MSIFNRFQGDPAIGITDGGAVMVFIGGQPVMDQGLHNSVIISLFTKPGWWGNTLADSEEKEIGSDYEQIRIIIDTQTINDTRIAAERALEWLEETGLAGEITIEVFNPIGDQIHTYATIKPPGADVQEFLFTQNGKLWKGQAQNPAQERLNSGL